VPTTPIGIETSSAVATTTTHWLKNKAAATLWSGPDASATAFTDLPAGSFVRAMGPADGSRLPVYFVGDGLLAVFGAPRRQPDHADEALAAALEIQDVVSSGDAGPLEIGLGLNSGTVVAGNIGGDRRFEFSVIGDAVNVAARVEAATRQTGDTVLLTDRTAALLDGGRAEREERPGWRRRGRRGAVPVYAPRAPAGESARAH